MAKVTQKIVLPRTVAQKVQTRGVGAGYAKDAALRKDNNPSPNQALSSLRTGTSAAALVRNFYEIEGMISAVVVNHIATASSGWHLEAYDTGTREFSTAGLIAAESVVSWIDSLGDYSQGYQDKPSMNLLVMEALLETLLAGGVGLELVLNKAKLPDQFVLFSYDSIEWRSDGANGRRPVQRLRGSEDVELYKLPTVFIGEMLRPTTRVYAIPVVHSGFKSFFAFEDFVEDMRRVLRQSGQPRLLVKLDYQRVVQSAPPDAQSDSKKLSAYLETVRAAFAEALRNLNPEDALVYYDLAEVDTTDTVGEKKDYSELLGSLSGVAASALKSNLSSLGLRASSGSQNIASTEAMLAMKLAGLVQVPVEMVLSRALTLAVRLMGVDAAVKFKFDPVDLRPTGELEAHKAIAQNRVMELLSLGRVTDAEAQVMLGLGSLPADAPLLSGTGFYSSKAPDTTPVTRTNALNQDVSATDASSGGADNAAKPG